MSTEAVSVTDSPGINVTSEPSTRRAGSIRSASTWRSRTNVAAATSATRSPVVSSRDQFTVIDGES